MRRHRSTYDTIDKPPSTISCQPRHQSARKLVDPNPVHRSHSTRSTHPQSSSPSAHQPKLAHRLSSSLGLDLNPKKLLRSLSLLSRTNHPSSSSPPAISQPESSNPTHAHRRRSFLPNRFSFHPPPTSQSNLSYPPPHSSQLTHRQPIRTISNTLLNSSPSSRLSNSIHSNPSSHHHHHHQSHLVISSMSPSSPLPLSLPLPPPPPSALSPSLSNLYADFPDPTLEAVQKNSPTNDLPPLDSCNTCSLEINNTLIAHPPSKPQRHSFWSGLGLRDRSNSRKNSSVTLAAYPNQIYKSSTMDCPIRHPASTGPSRAIAMVGNIRRGIGRMILEELVTQKFIVVALIDKPDGDFSRSVEALASSPSLFHAFAVDGGLFGQPIIGAETEEPSNKLSDIDPDRTASGMKASRRKSFRSFRLTSKKSNSSNLKADTPVSSATCSSTLGDSITENSSILSSQLTHFESARLRSIAELKNIFQAYRVDTVICCFEPQVLEEPAGPRSKARAEDERQFGLPPATERTRIESMERTVLESCLASGVVGRFAVTVHSTCLGPSVLSPHPTQSIRPHLLSVLSAADGSRVSPHPPISVTEFRWGFLMNDLAIDEGLVDGATAENGLGKWLCEPPKSRWVVDYDHRRCILPAKATSKREAATGKGKQRLEPVCMTLAEDAARFVGLACKLKRQWEWKTGKMVGDFVQGGWDEVAETIEKMSKKKFQREYVCVGTMVNGYSYTSGSTCSNSSFDQQKQISNLDLTETSVIMTPQHQNRLLVEDFFKYEDELRANLAKENLDASSVRLREFARVWFTPLPQPPSIVVDGTRLRKRTSRAGLSRTNPASRIGSSSSLKPQVAENGELRPAVKAGPINTHQLTGSSRSMKPAVDGVPTQFLSVPPPSSSLAPSSSASVQTSVIPPSNPSEPRSQAQIIPPSPVNGRPLVMTSNHHHHPLKVHSIPQPNPSAAPPAQHGAEFNFVPKLVVPFGMAQAERPPLPRPSQPAMNYHEPIPTGTHVTTPSSTLAVAGHHHGMVSSALIGTHHVVPPNNHHHQALPLPPQNKTLSAPRRPTGTLSQHHGHPVNPPMNNHYYHPSSGMSLSTPRQDRDENRLLRRSPLATRVA